MDSIHITLIGGQTIPIYNGIKHFPADRVFLIHSNETLEQAKLIAGNVKNQDIAFVKIDPNDYRNITEIISGYQHLFRGIKVTCNITGGTKLMSLALYEALFSLPDVDFLYIDQNSYCTRLRTGERSLLPVFNNTRVVFSLMGEKINKFLELDNFDFDVKAAVQQIRNLQNNAKNEYNELVYIMAAQRKNSGKTAKGSSFTWDSSINRFSMTLRGKQDYKLSIQGKYAIDIVRFTKWFELEVALMLQNWQHAKEILLSVEVNYEGGNGKNEIDVLVNTGTKLVFIECKTKLFDIKDLDKFRNVVKNYGGFAAKSVFIVDKPLRKHQKEKCADNKILTFCISEAKNYSSMSVEQQLFFMLERELNLSNTV